MKHRHQSLIHSHILYAILVIGFVFTLQLTLPMYINSSFLGSYVSESTVGIIYIIGSVLTILGFLATNKILTRYGNHKTALTLIGLQAAVILGIILSDDFRFIAFFFVISTALSAMIGLTIDIFLEIHTDVRHAGGIRGLFMTVINIAWIIAPLVGGAIMGMGGFRYIYGAALCFLVLLAYLVSRNFRHFHDPAYSHIPITKTVMHVLRSRDLTMTFCANIILNIFYAWMVIYTPIYLHSEIGFSWDEIGVIFTVMLLPFIIFQYPLGKIADSKLGEKEMMTLGFIITAIATYALTFITVKSVVLWSAALFMTRVGASTAEVMIETYFFKKVDPRESKVLSLFRITRPIAYIIAPAVTGLALMYTGHSGMFIVLGILTGCAIFFTIAIRDTN